MNSQRYKQLIENFLNHDVNNNREGNSQLFTLSDEERKELFHWAQPCLTVAYDALTTVFGDNEVNFQYPLHGLFPMHYGEKDNETYQEIINFPEIGGYDENEELPPCETLRPYLDNVRVVVHIPEKTVENEYGKKHVIKDVYLSFYISSEEGCLLPNAGNHIMMTRGEYDESELFHNYMHSHAKSIPGFNPNLDDDDDYCDDRDRFYTHLCFGSGPIIRTIDTIEHYLYGPHRQKECHAHWLLFATELEAYVGVESLDGVPYHKLEALDNNVSNKDWNDIYTDFPFHMGTIPMYDIVEQTSLDLKEVIPQDMFDRYIKHFFLWTTFYEELPIYSFRDGQICFSRVDEEMWYYVSRDFIKWYNELPQDERRKMNRDYLFPKFTIKDGMTYRVNRRGLYSRSEKERIKALADTFSMEVIEIFKGKKIHPEIHFDDNQELLEDKTILLHPNLAAIILYTILAYLNFVISENNLNKRKAYSVYNQETICEDIIFSFV